MQIKQRACEFKTNDDDNQLKEGEFIAYPSTFTQTPDCYGDIVAKGAFTDTIKAWKDSGNTLPVMYGHRMDDPDYNVAGVEDMGEDDHGFWIKGVFDMDSPKAPQVYRLLKAKRLSQLSFAYDVEDEGTVTLDDGTKANELRKLDIYEASFVPVGANQDTSVVAIKSATDTISTAIKSGRVLSAANTDMFRGIAKELTDSATKINDFLDQVTPDPDGKNNQSESAKASAKSTAKTEEPPKAKVEEPSPAANRKALELAINIALMGGKE
ncbi:HK97 family phage prohead protease [Bifidobacterium sp. ESL0775]|uniref:HK97 family phage prohead protease n=1 Tax=Bifidobacterium sp. ESL0775 TaxID=2983230 RepID=UPI0023F7F176|nr:HK97 family phage prohead protease [Bifidobacterium sp. ESL0775]WEV68724.1 HK97 family phage prohead protease [Bifidobacterium sp. ESL0775]